MKMHRFLFAGLLVWAIAGLGADPEPTLYEGFTKGKIDGPVGKAGGRFRSDGRGIVNMDRGTIAFFHQSKVEPREREWGGMGGVTTTRDAGYWSMGVMFQTRRQEFLFNFFDVGFYAPPLKFASIFGRWKSGEWHHLAAVWDRDEGITVFEDGKRANSNWGSHRWEWNLIPERLSLAGPIDEVYVFADCLTDAQITQLAAGKRPTGAPIPITTSEGRRLRDLARMGWSDESLTHMPLIEAGSPRVLSFARINRCVDSKRPVAYPFEGILRSTWPSHKYGPSTRGQRLEIELDPGQSYDRVRVFTHRNLVGEFAAVVNGEEQKILDVDAPHAMYWHRRLPTTHAETRLVLKRRYGQLGQIDFYRVDAMQSKDRPRNIEDFYFRKTSAFPDGEQGKVLMGETPRRFWNPLEMTRSEAAAWQLTTPAFGGFQAIADQAEESKAYDGALVELVVEGLTQPTPVRIEIKEPVYPERVWLAADVVLKPRGTGRQTFTLLLKGRPVINLPAAQRQKYWKDGRYHKETEPVPGVGFAVILTAASPAKWAMGRGGCAVKLCVTDMRSALPVAVDDQVEWMREAYAELMEGHAYRNKKIVTPLMWLTRFAPERMEVRQMYERVGSPKYYVGIDVPKLVYPEPKNTTGAPDWAFWQRQTMNRHREHLHWIIDNKQIWTGEFGGVWNDDSTHVENWMGYMLCLDGSGKIKQAMDRYWDGAWTHQLTEGVGKYTQDTCHFSEEGSSAQAMRVLIDYGDPVAYARAMASASHLPKWFDLDKDGRYVFKSIWVGPEGAWTEGAFLINKRHIGHGFDIVVPMGYLTWYNRHPAAADFLRKADVAGHRLLGPALDRVTDLDAARKRYEEVLVKKVGRRGPGAHIHAIQEIGVTGAARKMHAGEYKPVKPIKHYWGSKDTDVHWFNWKLSGDIRFLVDSYKRVCEWFYSHDWLNSAAMPSMDRCPLPRGSLIRSRIGALAANRGSSGVMWPRYALSYTKGGDQVAALVTENLPNRFVVRLYPFTDEPHDVQIRTWRCNGTFEVTLAHDKNDDGQAEEVFWKQRLELDRGAFVNLKLPPKQASILAVTPVKVVNPDFNKADPAISLNSVELVYGDHLVVKVYNNGTKPVDDVLVRVRDARSGAIFINGEKHAGPIEAPLDLKPQFKTVEFKNINCNTWGTILIEIDPDKKIDDLNRHNNRVVLKCQATYLKHEGWK